MSTFILVHGSWLDASCWRDVVARLEGAGHRAIARDLPGHGTDETPRGMVTTADYVRSVVADVDESPAPVVLVGHSMAGTVISQVAEARPDRIKALVYVCAFLLGDGESILQAAGMDPDSRLGPAVVPDEANGIIALRPEAVTELFFHDCVPDVAARAAARYAPDPIQPLVTPVRVSAARFGRVPRVYVETANDRVISLAAQRRMQAALPCATVRMATGHSPFLAAPDLLAMQLAGEAVLGVGAGAMDAASSRADARA